MVGRHLLSHAGMVDRHVPRLNFPLGALIGFFLGLAFGVGCALAVMYSIYMGGYRAAVRESRLPVSPDRWTREVARCERQAK